jgi:hypothetical protein
VIRFYAEEVDKDKTLAAKRVNQKMKVGHILSKNPDKKANTRT